MSRSPIAFALALVLASWASVIAPASPVPAAAASTVGAAHHSPAPAKTPAFTNRLHAPKANGRVSAQACDRRSIGVDNARGQLGPGNASKSQTLVAIPIGGGSAASATRQAQVDQACRHAH